MTTCKRCLKGLYRLAQISVVLLGLAAFISLTGLVSPTPWLRLVRVDGISMEPTLHNGQQVIFARLPFTEGSIVLAEDEEGLVVKRVLRHIDQQYMLVGDNRRVSSVHHVPAERVLGVMLCRNPLVPPMEIHDGQASADLATR